MTVTTDQNESAPDAAAAGHTKEALALLAALDAELAENSETEDEPLEWSAAERAVREMIADTVDRRVDLQSRYRVCADVQMRVKLSSEIRLLEGAIARLLKQLSTEVPDQPTAWESSTSRKASKAALTRWAGRGGRHGRAAAGALRSHGSA
ncbi:hypothetical protein AWC31_14835 [Mycolicibacterium wolinskyi]|uniref:Uncharacterized protein n=1 Tax=Mycolicibacterium wolinskyi TaxID=59750 RepID=A0A1X2FH43_9MYCO|nr:hypothetical protein AWC31_14835 [Mycolicibacterium wolinskyi]